MSLSLEYKKIKRTGLLPGFLGGSLLAAAVPVANMAFRSQLYLSQPYAPVQILLEANWQLMAMLNVLLLVAGACLLYHTEYADNALLKMKTLPTCECSIFFGKALLLTILVALTLAIEAGGIAFCSWHWFGNGTGLGNGLGRSFGFALLLMLPCTVLGLLIAQACRNMWISLGIGVVCIFTATALPSDSFLLSLFPFALPFRLFAGTDMARIFHYSYAAAAELALFCLAEPIYLKIRRS